MLSYSPNTPKTVDFRSGGVVIESNDQAFTWHGFQDRFAQPLRYPPKWFSRRESNPDAVV